MTASSAEAATAASAAVPPARITSIAASAASGCDVATIAFSAWTVDRPARWKFLMPNCSLYRFIVVLPDCPAGGITWHIPELMSNAWEWVAESYRGLSLRKQGPITTSVSILKSRIDDRVANGELRLWSPLR